MRNRSSEQDEGSEDLRSRLLQQKAEEQRESLASERRRVGSGDRSERTHYSFPQNRVTDHRIGSLSTSSIVHGR